jgi:hypothetical protein
LALGFESFRSPAKFAKRFESSNPDSRIRLTTTAKQSRVKKSEAKVGEGGIFESNPEKKRKEGRKHR